MAHSAGLSAGPIGVGRRVVEWGLLATVLLVLLVLFLQKNLEVQGQAEVAGVRTTLAALRTALVLDHIRSHSQAAAPVVVSQQNPFALLQQLPTDYRGELAADEAPAIGWYFDKKCHCVAYAASALRRSGASGAGQLLVFRVVGSDGPAQLVAMDRYSMHGQRID